MIYGTDMGRHVADMKEMKEMLLALGVETDEDAIVDEENESYELFH